MFDGGLLCGEEEEEGEQESCRSVKGIVWFCMGCLGGVPVVLITGGGLGGSMSVVYILGEHVELHVEKVPSHLTKE